MKRLETIAEIEQAWKEAGAGWMDPDLPQKQYEMVVKNELEAYKNGAKIAPYDAFIQTLLKIPPELDKPQTKFLDVGASGGYYREIMRTAGFKYEYRACDWNIYFRQLAHKLYPDMKFDVADARALPYPPGYFDIVMSACCMLHIREYAEVIAEAARVARRYVIFHRQPILFNQSTQYYKKEAYGVPCVEIHFGEREFMMLLTMNKLKLVHLETIFSNNEDGGYAHITYLAEKEAVA